MAAKRETTKDEHAPTGTEEELESKEVYGVEEEKRKSVFQTLTPDECLEGITILTGIGAPMEMKEFIFDRLTLAGAPPSKEFFDEVKKALIVLGAQNPAANRILPIGCSSNSFRSFKL